MLVLFSALMEVKGLNTKTVSSIKDKFIQKWKSIKLSTQPHTDWKSGGVLDKFKFRSAEALEEISTNQ